MNKKPSIGDLQVWWIPQVPGKRFHVPVASLTEAKKLLGVLADYDIFQFENKIKPDYSNAGGLERFEEDGFWYEWYDEETDGDISDWTPPTESA